MRTTGTHCESEVRKVMVRPVEVRPLVPYRIWLRYQDGSEGEVDLSHLAGRGVFTAWEQEGVFAQVKLGSHGQVEWPGETRPLPGRALPDPHRQAAGGRLHRARPPPSGCLRSADSMASSSRSSTTTTIHPLSRRVRRVRGSRQYQHAGCPRWQPSGSCARAGDRVDLPTPTGPPGGMGASKSAPAPGEDRAAAVSAGGRITARSSGSGLAVLAPPADRER